jgi:uncharacterized protein (TIGR00290 family)
VKPKALVSWSSGKDSAFALHEARRANELELCGLLTTVTSTFQRVSMHGVRETVLEAQAQAVGLPLRKVSIASPCSAEDYERAMAACMDAARADGITHVVFGDLFLADLRAYREAKLASIGMRAVFPLWERDTKTLASQMIESGLSAIVTCVDPKKLDGSFAGRRFDASFVSDLPSSVDPCGENGEFHTCVVAGPMFAAPLDARRGEIVQRDGYVFADVGLNVTP